jgi:hypothetical protein
MSAYIVDKEHIVYLVSAAMSRRITHYRAFSWYWKDAPQIQDRHRKLEGDHEQAAEVANMLWRENIKSVSHRYPNESSSTLPGPINTDWTVEAADFRFASLTPDPVQVLKSIACYEYQTCEHPEFEQSEAYAFVKALESAAIGALPGYDDAEWGAPSRKQESEVA